MATRTTKRDWTKRDDRKLLSYRRRGMLWDEIGELLERTAASCASRHRLLTRPAADLPSPAFNPHFDNEPPPPIPAGVTPERIAEFIELRGPLTTSRLAQLMCASETAVRMIIGKSGGRFLVNDDEQWVLNAR